MAILVAAKVGLYKIFLGIAFVVAAIKAMVVMAWALAMSKNAPELFPSYKHSAHPPNIFMEVLINSFRQD